MHGSQKLDPVRYLPVKQDVISNRITADMGSEFRARGPDSGHRCDQSQLLIEGFNQTLGSGQVAFPM
jgi:hypothetical protein